MVPYHTAVIKLQYIYLLGRTVLQEYTEYK